MIWLYHVSKSAPESIDPKRPPVQDIPDAIKATMRHWLAAKYCDHCGKRMGSLEKTCTCGGSTP